MTTEYRIQQLELGQEELWHRLVELEHRARRQSPGTCPRVRFAAGPPSRASACGGPATRPHARAGRPA